MKNEKSVMNKINYKLQKNIGDNVKSDALVLGLFKDNKFDFSEVDSITNSIISEMISSKDLSSENGKIEIIHTPKKIFKSSNFSKIFIVGLGNPESADNNSVRSAFANLGRLTISNKINNISFLSDSVINYDANFHNFTLSAFEGFFLGRYKFEKYKSNIEEEKEDTNIFIISSKNEGEIKSVVEKSIITATAEMKAKTLVNEPANTLSPTELSNYSKKLANSKIHCKILEEDECKKLGMNAFLGVGQGSVEPSKLIHLSYKPKKNEDSVWFIGKAIMFDSGGLSLKPSGSMLSMKGDMGGSASVISAIEAIANLNLDINIEALCLATENMPSGSAQRPSDVVKAMDGTYIEIENTDAEGRLTLADAVTYAKKMNAKAIIDVATLTGAAAIGLGRGNISGFSNDEKLMKSVIDAGLETGDSVWELPLDSISKKQNNSLIADIKNTGGRNAGTITAAHFIHHFVKDTPWVHLDIAANMMTLSDDRWHNKGATGIPTRLLIELANKLQK